MEVNMLHLSHTILKIIFLSIFLTSYNNSYSKDRDMKSNANISINDSMYISKTELEKLKIDASCVGWDFLITPTLAKSLKIGRAHV